MTILVVVEAVLLVLVLSKLLYDYRQYHRTGELPWLARSVCCSACSVGYDIPVKSENRNQTHHMENTNLNSMFLRCFKTGSGQELSEASNSSKSHLDLFRPKRYFLSPRLQNGLAADIDSIDVSSTNNDEFIAPFHNRTKKISIEEAEKLDKNVLDPDLEEQVTQPILIVHQIEDQQPVPSRKISRLQNSQSSTDE